MSEHKKFQYLSLEDLRQDVASKGLNIPISENLDILKRPVQIGNTIISNRLAIHPMEGCDSMLDGRPDELMFRRYDRFARGGAGLLWVEACAVAYEGRANPRQLYINKKNLGDFKKLVQNCIKAAQEEFGPSFRPYLVLQLTHSGRYSKPEGRPAPMRAVKNPYLDTKLTQDFPVITDEELERLENRFVEAACLAREAGFDAVDIKSCHGYLNSELLSAFMREGRYGGSFENRTRFFCNIIDNIQAELGDSINITTRMNAYDSVPYPYGWGVDKNDFHIPDLTEPKRLVKILNEKGIKLINISCGNPYYNPHVGRPYDLGPYTPPNHPLTAEEKMLHIIRDIQQCVPEMTVMATGFSWLREYGAHIAAEGIKQGWFEIAGFGRQAFAYPDFAKDIIEKGRMDRQKCCIACSRCTVIMRDGGRSGCVPKDAKVYGPIYREGRRGKVPVDGKQIAEHI